VPSSNRYQQFKTAIHIPIYENWEYDFLLLSGMLKAEQNQRIEIARRLITKSKIKRFSALFSEGHLYPTTLAKLINKSPKSLKTCINNPGKFHLEDIYKIAETLQVEHMKLLEIIYEDQKAFEAEKK
jgi:hypothetical protein